MRELDIYLPTIRRDRRPVDPQIIDQVKISLANAFGGYTHLQSRCEGAWRIGGVTFQDEVTILRVLDSTSTPFDISTFRQNLETLLDLEKILFIAREVAVL